MAGIGDVTWRFGASGFNALEARLRAIPRAVRAGVGIEMETIAEEILVTSQREFVPIQSGALAMSGNHDYFDTMHFMMGQGNIEFAIWYGSSGGVNEHSGWLEANAATGTGVNRMSRASHPRNYLGLLLKQGGRGTGNLGGGGAERHIQRNALPQEGVTVKDPSLYAIKQHEDFQYIHNVGPGGERPGQAKYLEMPFNMFAPSLAPRCAAAVKRALELTAEQLFGEASTNTPYRFPALSDVETDIRIGATPDRLYRLPW